MAYRGAGLHRLPGDVAEVWSGDRKVGVLFGWTLSGANGAWEMEAGKQALDPQFEGGEVEIRMFITARSERVFQIRGVGHLRDWVADGTQHRQVVTAKGVRLWTVTNPIPNASS